ncbi:MAG: Heavy-metal-associated domain protein [Bacteroidetes bacterium ADurb.BinA261]|nr:MAG: Heavy-metal-associated domain protein [Bacteroidetes bacterium ADurb.BinA261]HQG07935.1 heavy-metal-associated domain-containing protein [Dysgonamonadaceae bacterium]
MFIALYMGIGLSQTPKKQANKEVVKVKLDDMCDHCVKKIDSNIAFEKGVTALDYDRPNNTVNVTYRTDKTDTTKLRKAFEKVKLNVLSIEKIPLQ